MQETPLIEYNSHGTPRRGYVLSTAVEEIAKHIRAAVDELKRAKFGALGFDMVPDQSNRGGNERMAWHTVSCWLTGVISGHLSASASLTDAMAWFYGKHTDALELGLSGRVTSRVAASLAIAAGYDGLRELLPYVLDAHGPGSRLSVRRDPTTKVSRQNKKAGGIFYTPPDVASYMAQHAVEQLPLKTEPHVLDPATGTGVFLRSVLSLLGERFPDKSTFDLACVSLFGCDVDPLALDGAATVLLVEALSDKRGAPLTPQACWARLRQNLVCYDALLLDPPEAGGSTEGRISIDAVFPGIDSGFDLIIGNPPYASVGERSDASALAERFTTLENIGLSTDFYPAFIEQMVRLAAPKASGSMVVPLSIACNSGSQFQACREFMQRQPGTWRFAFFDRQPHALFGEDVKTRNAILFWDRQGTETRLETGPLRRWRGDDRRKMFKTIEFTPFVGDISFGIPKLDGSLQAGSWKQLATQPTVSKLLLRDWGRATLRDLPHGSSCDVFVAPTAYNFLGVARPVALKADSGEALSVNPYHKLIAKTGLDASCLYAILASNFAYWWWYVTSDGFHVNQTALHDLPIGDQIIAPAVKRNLASLGDALWAKARSSKLRSLNRGRVSYAFPASEHRDIRRKIDTIITASLGLPPAFAGELERFNERVANAVLFEKHPTTTTIKEAKMALTVTPEMKEKSAITKDEWREYTKTVWSIANKGRDDHPAAFPVEIPHRLTKLFSFYGETVLDPFAGTGTTARAAIPLGRHTICIEQNQTYANIIRSECGELKNGHAKGFMPLTVVNGDSRNMNFIPADSVGLIVTSPPYWDKADYGDNEANLGNVRGYGEFFSSIRPVFEECYRVLAPGRKLCLVTANVNQHTDHGLLTFPLSTDFAVLLRSIGFVMINEIIWSKDGTGGKWGSFGAQRPIFGSYPYPPNFLFKNVHEYVLIFAKPSLTKTKGPKVKPYRDVMKGIDASSLYKKIDMDLPIYSEKNGQ